MAPSVAIHRRQHTALSQGCVGWKCYAAPLVDGGECASDLPAYIVDALRGQVADPRHAGVHLTSTATTLDISLMLSPAVQLLIAK